REFDAMQKANRNALVAVAVLVLAVVMGTGFVSFFMLRSVHRLAELAIASPTRHLLTGAPPQITTSAEPHLLASTPSIEQSTSRMLSTLGQLQRRVEELEHTAVAPLPSENGPLEAYSQKPASIAPEREPQVSKPQRFDSG